MSFLRLGTKCAVIDSRGRVLLSRREDLHIWNLPGGRLDSGEPLPKAAAREVLEETGVEVEITRPVCLYYWQNWNRLNFLFEAKPVGGYLLAETDETSDNRYFAPDALPDLLGPEYADHTRAATRPLPQIVTWSRRQLLHAQLLLRWRWIKNLLRGRLEPRFHRFDVRAVAAIYNEDHQHVITHPHERLRALPRIYCDGKAAPWVQLAHFARRVCPVDLRFHWVGLWQEVTTDTIELVFAATVPEVRLSGGAEWTQAQNAPLAGGDIEYIRRIHADYADVPVWMVISPAGYAAIISG